MRWSVRWLVSCQLSVGPSVVIYGLRYLETVYPERKAGANEGDTDSEKEDQEKEKDWDWEKENEKQFGIDVPLCVYEVVAFHRGLILCFALFYIAIILIRLYSFHLCSSGDNFSGLYLNLLTNTLSRIYLYIKNLYTNIDIHISPC